MNSWINYNALFRSVSDEQDCDPGSKWWLLGGPNVNASNTGGQNSYGWKHDHKLGIWGIDYVKGVLANYGHRPNFYANAPVRHGGYLIAGRPKDYKPELPGDQLDGQVSYMTAENVVTVSGLDTEHFQLGPLFSVADSKNYMVSVQGKLVDASMPARIMLKFHLKALRGHLMSAPNKLTSYVFSDRAMSLILGATVHGTRLGIIDQEDLVWLGKYVKEIMIPAYEMAPKANPGAKGSSGLNPEIADGMSFAQLYNGLYWTLPRFYEAYQLTPAGEDKKNLGAIVERLSTYMEDLEKANPGNGFPSAVSLPQPILDGIDGGKAVPIWSPFITKANLHYSDIDLSLWALRAGAVSAKVLGSKIMEEATEKNVAKWKAKAKQSNYQYAIQDQCWIVQADGSYF